jgi:hypothetical protein
MTRRIFSIAILMVLLTALLGLQASLAAARDDGREDREEATILEFESMVGVPQAFTGAQNPIRGINGGGIPWAIRSGKGELTADGRLEIKVRGLVLAAGANAGSNPAATFRAIVSCLGSDASVQNVMTDPFPATTGPASAGGGNARVKADLTLPQPCIAPIVFVTSAGGSWFASTGG